MKRLLIIGLVLGSVGIVGGGLFVVGDNPTNSDRLESEEKTTNRALLHVELVNNSEDLNGSVIEYADLTTEQQAVFKQVVTDDDQQAAIPDDTYQSVWVDNTAVRYQNRTYRVLVSEP